MTIEAAFIVILSLATFITFCGGIHCSQEIKRLEKQNTEMMSMIYGLTAYSKILADQDVKILQKIEETAVEFIRKEDVN